MDRLEHITKEQISKYGVVSAPDRLTGKAIDNKLVFDRLINDLISTAVNGVIDRVNEISSLDFVSFMRRSKMTISGLSWSWSSDKKTINISGNQTESSIYPLLAKGDEQIPGLSAGNWYYLDFKDDLAHVLIRVQKGTEILSYIDMSEPCYFFVPNNADQILVSVVISYNADATTVSKTIQAPKIYKNIPQKVITSQLGKLSCRLGIIGSTPSEEECSKAFIEEVNRRCVQYGMVNTHIENASGLDADLSDPSSQMSVSDMARLAIVCSDKADLLDLLSLSSVKFQIYGRQRRTVELQNSYLSTLKEQFSSIGAYAMGGKGGSLSYDTNEKFRTQLTFSDISGKLTALCLMGYGETSYNNIYLTCRDLASAIKNVYSGSKPVITRNLEEIVSSGGGYAAFEVPRSGTLYANQVPTSAILSKFHSVFSGESAVLRPCSVVKILTALVALDFIVDKSAFLDMTYNEVSVGGSGSKYYSTDRINIMDALRGMIVESSNALATSIGRYVGQIILTGKP